MNTCRGILYVVHHNGRMVAYDADSGAAFYKTRFSSGGTFTASPVAAGGSGYGEVVEAPRRSKSILSYVPSFS